MIRYDTIPAGWSSSRRCGLRFYTADYNATGIWGWYFLGTTNGNYERYESNPYLYVNCSLRAGPAEGNDYCAVCVGESYNRDNKYLQLVKFNTCPKGWGIGFMSRSAKGAETYTRNSQGYVKSYLSEPVYGYVTRYRTQYYNYITARVSKA